MGVVVARQEMPLDLWKQLYALKWSTQRHLGGHFIVEDVTGDKNVAGAFLNCQAADILDRRKPGLRRLSSLSPNCLNTLPICQSAVWINRISSSSHVTKLPTRTG